MTAAQIDYESVFQCLPTPALILDQELVMIDMNLAYQRISGRSRDELIGQHVFVAFPDNPAEPGASGSSNLGESLRRVLDSGKPEIMPLQRYDVEAAGSPGAFRERYWCPVNVPVRGPDGSVTCLLHVVEEVSDLIRKFVEAEAAND
jgi:PAS domain-containing protein